MNAVRPSACGPASRPSPLGKDGARALAFFLILLLSAFASAEPIVTMPLDGYYRPGRFFPVRIESDRTVEVQIDSPGGVGAGGSGTELELPVMRLSPVPGTIKVTIDGRSRELAVRPAEIGTSLPQPALQGAFVYDAPPAARGPASALEAGAYDLAAAFAAQRSPAVRRTVWLALAMFAIVAIATAMLHWRHAALAVGGLAVLWTAVAAAYYATRPRVTVMEGIVTLRHGEQVVQQQRWVFRTALQATEDAFTFPADAGVLPILAGQGESLQMRLEKTDGGWRCRYHLRPGGKIIFVLDEPAAARFQPANRVSIPVMLDIARRYYQRPGDKPSLRTDGKEAVEWVEVELAR